MVGKKYENGKGGICTRTWMSSTLSKTAEYYEFLCSVVKLQNFFIFMINYRDYLTD